jgi:primary-amine oxidase
MRYIRCLNVRHVLIALALVSIACAVALSDSPPSIAQSTRCSSAFLIDTTLANGARWSLCWEERANEGIVLYDVHYTPPGNRPSRLIFYQIGLAEIHVPYDDNSARFFDLSVFGLGGDNLQDLAPGDCPGGTLRQNTTGKYALCQTVTNEGYAYKFYSTQKQASALTLFSVSAISNYNYVVQWKFYDDGTAEPSVGATGRLQRCTADSRYGWPLGSDCTRGTSHMHNYWWRIDMDLNGSANDRLQRIQFAGSGTDTRAMSITSHTIETRSTVSQATFRSWRVEDTATTNGDNHNISYELVPESSHVFRGPSYEPWTANDIYLTQFNACEQFLTHNPTTGGCGDNVTQFATTESVSDLVLWYGTSFHHLARDEDEPNMSIHWSRFQIVPRDMTATNPR